MVFDSADELLKKYNIPHRVSRFQKEIYWNEPLCFVILPYSWDKQVLEDLRAIPGVMERRAFNTENGRYRKFDVHM